jgi:hypothetical protein
MRIDEASTVTLRYRQADCRDQANDRGQPPDKRRLTPMIMSSGKQCRAILPLCSSKALGNADTDSAWTIGYFAGRPCIVTAPDIYIAVLIEHVLDEQPQVEIHVVTSKVGPHVKD